MELDPSPVFSEGPGDFSVELDISYEQVWKRLRMLALHVSRKVFYIQMSQSPTTIVKF